jgi:hypothetical protein
MAASAMLFIVPPDRPRDPFDIELTDEELQDEVELLTQLILAANASGRPLEQAEVDRVLFHDD